MEIEKELEWIEELNSVICTHLMKIIESVNGLNEAHGVKKQTDDVLFDLVSTYPGAPGKLSVQDILKKRLELYEKNIIIPEIAGSCYERAIEIDPNYAIKLMGAFIKATHDLSEEERLYPLRNFLKNEYSADILENNINFFIENVLPTIIELSMVAEFKEMGLNFIIHAIDTSSKDDIYLEINFKNDEKAFGIINENMANKISSYFSSKHQFNDFDQGFMDNIKFLKDFIPLTPVFRE
jgi:hypothetical protein